MSLTFVNEESHPSSRNGLPLESVLKSSVDEAC